MSHKAIFLDRDDTLINDPGYIDHPDQVDLLPGAAEALTQFKRMGFLVIIITNQSAIARGYLTEEKLDQIHQKLKTVLTAQGAGFDRLYYCPYHPDGTVAEFAKESPLRKPSPGMLHQAAEELDIDLSQSWMIGDRYRDIEAGQAAGCHTILVDVPGKARPKQAGDPEPDRRAVNLREAVNIIRMYEFHRKAQAAKKEQESAQAATTPSTAGEPAAASKPHAAEKPSFFPAAPLKTAPPSEPEPAPEPPANPQAADAPAVEPKPTAASEREPAQASRSRFRFHTTRPAVRPETADGEAGSETQRLLQEILQRVTASRRTELFDEFSVHKLLAGMAQVLALGCIVYSLYLLLSPEAGTETVLVMIGYGVALQLLVISLLLMHRRD